MRRGLAALLLAATLAGVLAAPAVGEHRYAGQFGGIGRGPGLFGPPRPNDTLFRLRKSPTGIAVDRDGTLWVADPRDTRIEHFSTSGRYLGGFGHYGVDLGGLHRPEGVMVGPGGELDIVSNGNDRIDRLWRDGRFLGVFHIRRSLQQRYGLTRGAASGQVSNAYGIAGDRRAHFYVTDLGNARVNRYDIRGRGDGQLGGFGTGRGRFLAPFGVAVDPAGNVWVSDRDLNRIQKFRPSGRLLRVIGTTGSDDGEFLSPQGLASDRQGRLYVADTVNRRIEVFSRTGRFLESFGDNVLTEPNYLAVDRDCTVWVTDYRRVVAFADPGGC